MNVKIEYPAEFLSAVYWNDQVMFNCYSVRCEMITNSRDHIEQNIALERLKYILFVQMQNSVFVDVKEKATIKRLETAGLRTIALPELPVDQIVGMMLYSKLDAVMEGRIVMSQLRLSSDLGENVVYSQTDTETIGPFQQRGWWNSAEPGCSDAKPSAGKVVSIATKAATWQSLDLHWDQEHNKETDNTVVVFRKDDKE